MLAFVLPRQLQIFVRGVLRVLDLPSSKCTIYGTRQLQLQLRPAEAGRYKCKTDIKGNGNREERGLTG